MLYDYVCDNCDQEILDVYQSINDEPIARCPECGQHKLRRIISCGSAAFVKGSSHIRNLPGDTGGTQEAPKPSRKKQWYDDSGSATKQEITKMTNKQKQNYIMRGKN